MRKKIKLKKWKRTSKKPKKDKKNSKRKKPTKFKKLSARWKEQIRNRQNIVQNDWVILSKMPKTFYSSFSFSFSPNLGRLSFGRPEGKTARPHQFSPPSPSQPYTFPTHFLSLFSILPKITPTIHPLNLYLKTLPLIAIGELWLNFHEGAHADLSLETSLL